MRRDEFVPTKLPNESLRTQVGRNRSHKNQKRGLREVKGKQASKKGGSAFPTCCLEEGLQYLRRLLVFLHSHHRAKLTWSLSQVAVRIQNICTAQGLGSSSLSGLNCLGDNSIYTNQIQGIQGKEGECGGWIYGIKHPKSNTPPQSPCSPCRSRRRDKPQCQVGIQRAIQEKTWEEVK